jgi:cytochrome c-type biogenesis protein CcmF
MLLWVLMLTFWTFAVASFSRHLPDKVRARTLAGHGLALGRLPALRARELEPVRPSPPMPADGRDLNPLLQDPGMVFHPPMLYMATSGSRSPSPSPSRR